MTAFIDMWRALLEASAVAQVPAPGGILIASGPDALDFLHRMSTHAVEAGDAESVRGVLNCFVDKRGRIVDVVHMRIDGPERVTLFCERSAADLKRFLEGFLFMEEAELAVVDTPLIRLVGAGAVAAVQRANATKEDASAAEKPSRFIGDQAVRAFDYAGPSGEPIPTVLVAGSDLASLTTAPDVLAAEVSEAARIAAGVPAAPGELSDAHNPLELDLHDAIDWKKGCYIGQEVISRIDNYGKQAKRLVAVRLDREQLLGGVDVGDAVFSDDKRIGALTSVTSSACRSAEMPIALALLKLPPLEGPSAITIGEERVPAVAAARMAAQEPHD